MRRQKRGWGGVWLVLILAACSAGESYEPIEDVTDLLVLEILADTAEMATDELAEKPEIRGSISVRIMTFNVGTTNQALHDKDEEAGQGDGYTSQHADWIAEYGGNNLAWRPAAEALQQFIALEKPDIVAFQEMFYDPWCEDAPDPPDELDLICGEYEAGGLLTVERILGPDYQVVSADGHVDNWVGVRRDFGTIVGIPTDGAWLDGAKGFGIPDCCSGARVSSIDVELTGGQLLTVVNVHTNAGMKDSDMACRVIQFEQVWVDRGDGLPASYGNTNVIMGDMNTDPFLFAGADPSADRWNDFVGPLKDVHYLSSDSSDGPPTHATGMRLDHVVTDGLQGTCYVPGSSPETKPVMPTSFFDHRPVVCDVVM